jgi:hypothetical protein
VTDVVAQSGVCLIVDCHSFASVALPYELDQTSERADICVGTDSFHTPSLIRDAVVTQAKGRVIRLLLMLRLPVRWFRLHLIIKIGASCR